MSTLLNKSYLVKVSTKGEGGQKCPKFCLRGLYTAPNCKQQANRTDLIVFHPCIWKIQKYFWGSLSVVSILALYQVS